MTREMFSFPSVDSCTIPSVSHFSMAGAGGRQAGLTGRYRHRKQSNKRNQWVSSEVTLPGARPR